MSGDFSRFTFDSNKNYTQVLMQQGRMLLDADWNEMQAILHHQQQALVNDLVGQLAFPAEHPAFSPKVRGGLSFDGKDDFLLVETGAIDFSQQRHFSLVAEVALAKVDRDIAVFSQWQHLSEFNIDSGLCFGVTAQGHLYLTRTVTSDDAIDLETLQSEVVIDFERPVKLAVTFDGLAIRFFVDGTMVLEQYEPAIGIVQPGLVVIGALLEANQTQRCMAGRLMDLAIYSRAVSSEELRYDDFVHRQVGEMGLCAWWPFTDASGEQCRDIAGRNHAQMGAGNPDCFPQWHAPAIDFSAGRVYLNGSVYQQKQSLRLPTIDESNGHFLTYLELQQALVTAQDDPNLLEPGLQGVDTTVRTQLQVAVKAFPEQGTYATKAALLAQWQGFTQQRANAGHLKVNALEKRVPLRNTLYRVQIMASAQTSDDHSLKVVWSHDNSRTSFKVLNREENRLLVQGLKEHGQHLAGGSRFSLLDTDGKLLHTPDQLLTVTEVDAASDALSFTGELLSTAKPAKLLHWADEVLALKPNDHGQWQMVIDNRLRLNFRTDDFFHEGDFWLIPTREVKDDIALQPDSWLPPFAGKRQYAPIAFLQASDRAIWVTEDKRQVFVPAVNMDQFLKKSGGTVQGPMQLQDSLQVLGDSQFEGDLVINGQLNGNIIGTRQLQDHSVTHHKMARNLGLHLGQCVLSQNRNAPPGYSVVGKIAGDTEHSNWAFSEQSLPQEGPFVAHNVGDTVLLLFGSGDLYKVSRKVRDKVMQFEPKARFPGDAVRRFGACATEQQLFIAGGETANGDKTQQFYVYHLNDDRWQALPHLPKAISHAGLAAVNDQIYLFGGMQSALFGLLKHSPSNVVYSFNLTTDNWIKHTHLPDYRYSGGVATVNGLIYYIGGSDKELSGILAESFCANLYVYDPIQDQWREKLPIPLPRSRFGTVVIDNKIYCIGGRTGKGYTANVQVYNPETDHWEAESSLITPKSHVAPVVLDEVIYALGGKVESTYLCDIEHQESCSEFFVHRLDNYLD